MLFLGKLPRRSSGKSESLHRRSVPTLKLTPPVLCVYIFFCCGGNKQQGGLRRATDSGIPPGRDSEGQVRTAGQVWGKKMRTTGQFCPPGQRYFVARSSLRFPKVLDVQEQRRNKKSERVAQALSVPQTVQINNRPAPATILKCIYL